MKIALIGDTHFGASKSSDIIHDYFDKFYNFLFDYLDTNNIKVIIQEGDLFDYRKEVHFNTLKRSTDYFFSKLEQYNIKMYCISGNHDSLFKNTNRINSVRLLATHNMYVVDMKPETIKIGNVKIDLFPWINYGNHNESIEYATKSDSDYAIGHFEFSGFPLHPGTIAESGMNHKVFQNYKTVFSGHYHTISQKDNILYTGTPCELNWSDCNDPKGFWILDTETGEYEHIRNPFTLFEKITYTDNISYDFSQVSGKYVKIVVASKTNQKKFDAFVDAINSQNPLDCKIIESSIANEVKEAVNVTDLVSTQKMILDVVDNMDIELDKSILKTNILELYTEAMNISNSL